MEFICIYMFKKHTGIKGKGKQGMEGKERKENNIYSYIDNKRKKKNILSSGKMKRHGGFNNEQSRIKK